MARGPALAFLTVLAFCLTASGAFAQVQSPVAAPWSAPAAPVVDHEEKSFVAADGVRLHGTLYYPHGGRRLAAVVVLHAAEAATADMPLYDHLKEILPSLDMAVLVFDRRGSGRSGASDKNHDFDVLAADGIAARALLAKDPRIDPHRIGYWGLSQGGWLSVLAATRDPAAAFAISVSAPMVTPDVQMDFAVANILRVNGYPQADIDLALATRRSVDAYLKGEGDRATALKNLDAARQRPWFKDAYMDGAPADRESSDWLKQMRLDPLATLRKAKVPVLMIYGGADPWVPVAVSAERLRAEAARLPGVETAVIAGADHEMMLSVPPKTQMDPKALHDLKPEAPAYFALMAAWLTRHGLARAPH
jgi:uncharacterized protein